MIWSNAPCYEANKPERQGLEEAPGDSGKARGGFSQKPEWSERAGFRVARKRRTPCRGESKCKDPGMAFVSLCEGRERQLEDGSAVSKGEIGGPAVQRAT